MSRRADTEVRPSVAGWVLVWRTPIMPAPAFWYFASEEEAREAESGILHPNHRSDDR
jgi:hypothetical protein